MVVWVVSRFRLKAPPGISSSCISPLTSSGQRSRASWASQPQKSATLSPQPGGKPRKFVRTCGGTEEKKNFADDHASTATVTINAKRPFFFLKLDIRVCFRISKWVKTKVII